MPTFDGAAVFYRLDYSPRKPEHSVILYLKSLDQLKEFFTEPGRFIYDAYKAFSNVPVPPWSFSGPLTIYCQPFQRDLGSLRFLNDVREHKNVGVLSYEEFIDVGRGALPVPEGYVAQVQFAVNTSYVGVRYVVPIDRGASPSQTPTPVTLGVSPGTVMLHFDLEGNINTELELSKERANALIELMQGVRAFERLVHKSRKLFQFNSTLVNAGGIITLPGNAGGGKLPSRLRFDDQVLGLTFLLEGVTLFPTDDPSRPPGCRVCIGANMIKIGTDQFKVDYVDMKLYCNKNSDIPPPPDSATELSPNEGATQGISKPKKSGVPKKKVVRRKS
jgi:hypothetical protein